ncbi:MAG: sulfur oxidation c-type cytochrome SoxX, partial [Epsilonproteobacteria bacterium]|nr:sulfur oxidation c-type cytochrome SoxX [Campylobacterota bacterium]
MKKAALIGALLIGSIMVLSGKSNEEMIKLGEKIFNTKKLGNCLACHAVNGKEIDTPGTLGPNLQNLS